MVESLCRLKKHWCIECCEQRCNILLGQLPDGSMGCTGHASMGKSEISQPLLCQEFNCLVIYHHTNPKEIEAIRDSILKYPEGKFRMSEIFAGFNNHG